MLLDRVRLKNYRSIAACDLRLGPLAFFVGPNGSGKSNFLDALRLVADSLNSSLDQALRERGGVQEVRRRSRGHPTHFGVRLDFNVQGLPGMFAFEVGARTGGEVVVKKEQCSYGGQWYTVKEGQVTDSSLPIAPAGVADRLYLVNASGAPQFRPVFDALSAMGFYSVSPSAIRDLQIPDTGDVLRRDGSNLASVVGRLQREDRAEARERILQYLKRVVPGVVGFESKRVGHTETIEFRQSVKGDEDPWRFPAINMSDGTLRVLALLVAMLGRPADGKERLVGIEEPETALHPGAAAVLRDCIREASRTIQILVTSHSAELLDDPDLSVDALHAVESDGGITSIAPIDEAARSSIRDRLFTPGELLRANQLAPDVKYVLPPGTQLELFEESAA